MAARASLAMSKWKKMMCEPRTLVKPSIPSLVGNSINSEMSNGVLSQGKLFFLLRLNVPHQPVYHADDDGAQHEKIRVASSSHGVELASHLHL